jgi:hypothetical protein
MHNKPKAEVHQGHPLTGPKEEDEKKVAPRILNFGTVWG